MPKNKSFDRTCYTDIQQKVNIWDFSEVNNSKKH